MLILIGGITCPDELKRHSKYNNTSGINRKTAFGNTLLIILLNSIFNIFQYLKILHSILILILISIILTNPM